MRRTRQNSLAIEWSKKERDFVFFHPPGSQTKTDSHYLHVKLGTSKEPQSSFFQELEERGYDLTTLRFSICKLPNHPRWEEPACEVSSDSEK
jgi:hypothetical protein